MKIFGRRVVGHRFQPTAAQLEAGVAVKGEALVTLCGLHDRLSQAVDLSDRAAQPQPWTSCSRCVGLMQNALEDRYNALEDQYNALEDQYNALVGDHNQLVDDYNELLFELARTKGD